MESALILEAVNHMIVVICQMDIGMLQRIHVNQAVVQNVTLDIYGTQLWVSVFLPIVILVVKHMTVVICQTGIGIL